MLHARPSIARVSFRQPDSEPTGGVVLGAIPQTHQRLDPGGLVASRDRVGHHLRSPLANGSRPALPHGNGTARRPTENGRQGGEMNGYCNT